MRTVSVAARRRAVVRRHHLDGDAAGPDEVTHALVALHATDPASVYLSVLARSSATTLADVSAAMYERRDLVRWMAMRRTLFLFPRADIPTVQAAVSTPLAATLRRQLVSRLTRNGSRPAVDGDVGAWLAGVESAVERALRTLGTATGAQLGAGVPGLRTQVLPRTPSEEPQNVTSSLLTLMSAEGRIVRSTPTGSWTSRQHRWEPVDRWWPHGLPALDVETAQQVLVRRWLERFGPATFDDLHWWTGWTKTAVRRALEGVPVDEVDLHGGVGIALPDQDDAPDTAGTEPTAVLLPALDPTPMGWKHRDWFFGIDQRQVFDRAGNIGPTLWWDGEIIGSWAVAASGEVRTAVLADRGTSAALAVESAARRLQDRLDGARVVPAARTPLERTLA